MGKSKQRVYANPILHAVRKRTTVVAVQLTDRDSLDPLIDMYLQVVNPESFDDEGELRVIEFDTLMGVLWFKPAELPLELTVGDWLVYDGNSLQVVHDRVFQMDYGVSRLHNRRLRGGRKETRNEKLDKIRRGEASDEEYNLWEF